MKASIFLLTDITEGIGGAEKRFFGLWLNLQKSGFDCRFVTHEKMLNQLEKTTESHDIDLYRQSIKLISLPKLHGASIEDNRNLRKFIRENLDKDEILHFVTYYPLMLGVSNPMIMSDTASNLNHLNLKGKILNYLKLCKADIVDLIDPKRADSMKKLFFFNPTKINLTSNTFVNLDKYKSLKVSEKENWLVFLGRFDPVKQILEFVRTIPKIHQAIKKSGIKNSKIFILGHGVLKEELIEILKQPEYNDIDIERKYEPMPSEILSQAKIFFSLQKYTNYPSKSLAEALASGCLPIATDNGTTRRIAKPEFSYYVPEKFNAEILADKVSEIFSLSTNEMQEKSSFAVEFAKKEFSIDKMTNYYLSLYQMLDKIAK